MIVEALDTAKARGARFHAEVLGVKASADGGTLPSPTRTDR